MDSYYVIHYHHHHHRYYLSYSLVLFVKLLDKQYFLSIVSELVRRFRNPPLRLIKRSTASLQHRIIFEGGTSETYFKF